MDNINCKMFCYLVKDVFDGVPVLFVNILRMFVFKGTLDPAVPLTYIFA